VNSFRCAFRNVSFPVSQQYISHRQFPRNGVGRKNDPPRFHNVQILNEGQQSLLRPQVTKKIRKFITSWRKVRRIYSFVYTVPTAHELKYRTDGQLVQNCVNMLNMVPIRMKHGPTSKAEKTWSTFCVTYDSAITRSIEWVWKVGVFPELMRREQS
jgi:hypothetical protein